MESRIVNGYGAHVQRLTAGTAGAIAVIAVTGGGARNCLAEICGRATTLPVNGVSRGTLMFHGQAVDDALIVCRHERHFEIHAHGGTAVVEQIFAALQSAGATIHDPRDGVAFHQALDGDLRAAAAPAILNEVLAVLPRLDNRFALQLLSNQHENGLAAWAYASHRCLRAANDATALWRVQTQAQWLIECSDVLRHFLQPPRVVLVGQPNAGKSTLLNALAGRWASITSDVAGTTRDWVDVTVRVTAADISLNAIMVDTAGIRATDDPLEMESILRSHRQTALADVVIVVLDGTIDERDVSHWAAVNQRHRTIYAVNKMDLGSQPHRAPKLAEDESVCISALTGDGIEALHAAILKALGLWQYSVTTPMLWTQRQRAILTNVSSARDGFIASMLLDELCGARITH